MHAVSSSLLWAQPCSLTVAPEQTGQVLISGDGAVSAASPPRMEAVVGVNPQGKCIAFTSASLLYSYGQDLYCRGELERT